MAIHRIGNDEITKVREIAMITWPVAFGEILSKEQLAYMMNMMYSEDVLEKQLHSGHEFYLYTEEGKALGFMGIEPGYKGKSQLKIHKLYILPNQQGKGIGQQFIALATERAKELKQNILTLNVNRFNKALHFYEKLGFANMRSEDIDIGKGYLMEDYVMEKTIL
ncbi:MAG: family N-acetyltransferase [Crocinitomicaceae bacterium]|jgi:GNAT superfamily N-acetyltransferase|nr:family N-acetyltransferase [Crocinitomicaceae bacterium]